MNIKERFGEIRRTLSQRTSLRARNRRNTTQPQQLEFSLPVIQRSRALRLSPSASR